MDVKRTLYDKFGEVMKTLNVGKKDNENEGIPETLIDSIESDIDESQIEDSSDNVEALWDLSELDPEIYGEVFEPLSGIDKGSKVTESSADLNIIEGKIVESDETIDEGIASIADKPRNVKNVQMASLDDTDEQVEIDNDENEPKIAASKKSAFDDDKISDDIFADKMEIRPQVTQLLQKYGTVSIEQLRQELDEVSTLLSGK